MNRIYLTKEGEVIGIGTQSLREYFNATIPDPPKESDLTFLDVLWVNEPIKPVPITNDYELSASVVDGQASVEWVGTSRFDDETINELRTEWNNTKLGATKAQAQQRINERMPEWKQRNYLAFSLEVTRKTQAAETVTAEENATITFIEGEWAFVKSIREASDTMEAEILALTDEAAGEYDVIDNVLWP